MKKSSPQYIQIFMLIIHQNIPPFTTYYNNFFIIFQWSSLIGYLISIDFFAFLFIHYDKMNGILKIILFISVLYFHRSNLSEYFSTGSFLYTYFLYFFSVCFLYFLCFFIFIDYFHNFNFFNGGLSILSLYFLYLLFYSL